MKLVVMALVLFAMGVRGANQEDSTLSFSQIESWVTQKKLKSVEELLPFFPPSMWEDPTLIYKS